LMQALIKSDRDAYLETEKKIRETVNLPPHGRLAALVISGADATTTERFARSIAQAAPLAHGVSVLGPAPAPIAMVRGRHRWRLLVKTNRDVNIQNFLREWLKGVKPKGSLKLQVDVDPYNFL
jgi:primosomal protein N' (replication factor Y) (superfamily II helicase)